jgi:hypothetical protein
MELPTYRPEWAEPISKQHNCIAYKYVVQIMLSADRIEGKAWKHFIEAYSREK